MRKLGIALMLAAMLVATGLFIGQPDARAEIDELVIAIGVDADTFNPQEQTTTLFQNMCDLIYGSFLYQDPEGGVHPRLA